MQRFIQPQPLHVRVSEPAADKPIFLPGHLIRGIEGFEGHIARVAGGLHQRQQLMQREADPGDHHRPGFHAAHTVNTLFQREAFGQIVMVKGQRLRHLTADGQRPGIGAQATRVRRRIGFIEAEFIKVIVVGDFIFRSKRQVSLPFSGFSKVQGLARRGWRTVVAFKPVQQVGLCGGGKRKGGRADAQHFQHLAPLEHKNGFGRDVGFRQFFSFHGVLRHAFP